MKTILDLPNELLGVIFCVLLSADIESFARVCQRFFRICCEQYYLRLRSQLPSHLVQGREDSFKVRCFVLHSWHLLSAHNTEACAGLLYSGIRAGWWSITMPNPYRGEKTEIYAELSRSRILNPEAYVYVYYDAYVMLFAYRNEITTDYGTPPPGIELYYLPREIDQIIMGMNGMEIFIHNDEPVCIRVCRGTTMTIYTIRDWKVYRYRVWVNNVLMSTCNYMNKKFKTKVGKLILIRSYSEAPNVPSMIRGSVKPMFYECIRSAKFVENLLYG